MPTNKYVLSRQSPDGTIQPLGTSGDIVKCIDKVKSLNPLGKFKWDRKENVFRTEVDGWTYTILKTYE